MVNKELLNAFEEKSDSFETWSPKKEGEYRFGVITQLGKSKTHDTLYVVLEDQDQVVWSVYLKMGLVGHFQRQKLVSVAKNNEKNFKPDWLDKAETDLVGRYIAIQYIGEETNERTNRTFEKYKVLWENELTSFIENAKTKKNESLKAEPKIEAKKKGLALKTKSRKRAPSNEEICNFIMDIWENFGLEKTIESSYLSKELNEKLKASDLRVLDDKMLTDVLLQLAESNQVHEAKPGHWNLILEDD